MKRASLSLVLIALSLMAFADIHSNAGKYSYQFLQIPVNPLSLSLAGRGVHSPENPMAWVFQPAASVLEARREVSASHLIWLDETTFSNLAYSYSTRKHHFGLILKNLDYGKIENRDDTGILIGHYNPIDLNLAANLAYRISPHHYVGVNAGVIYEKLNTASALAFSSDLGYTFLPPMVDTQISVSLRNLGFSGKMQNEKPKLPTTGEIDISRGISFDNNHVRFEVGANKAVDTNVRATLGTELGLSDLVFLRAGYKYNYDAEDLSAGLGFKLRSFRVDYAWAAFSNRLNDVHAIGVSYLF